MEWGAVPTEDRVRSLGIPITSKCVCCREPEMETAEHLFFMGDLAMQVWNFICPLFRKNHPKSMQVFLTDWGVSAKLRRFSESLAFGLASCALWEIWKSRCSRIHDEQGCTFTKGNILRWAGILTKSIGSSCGSDLGTVRMCEALNIVAPLANEFKVVWRAWRPHRSGNTCNIAIHISEHASTMAAIMRDRTGRFLFAMKASSTKKAPIKCFHHTLAEIQGAGFTISCIKAGSSRICDVGKFADIEWSNYHVKSKVVNMCRDVEVYRVCPAQNRPAEALCFASIRSLKTEEVVELPLAVARALSNDVFALPCSFYDQRVYM